MFAKTFFKSLLPGLGMGFIAILLSLTPFGTKLENHLFDAFMRWNANPAKWPDNIVLLLVDEQSLQQFKSKYRWPWPREEYAALIVSLKKAGVKEIAFDVFFSEESEDVLDDDCFAASIRNAGNVWLVTEQDSTGKNLEPVLSLKEAVGNHLAFANIYKSSDGVVRQYPVFDYWNQSQRKSLALRIANLSKPLEEDLLIHWYCRNNNLSEHNVISLGSILAKSRAAQDSIIRSLFHPKTFKDLNEKEIAELMNKMPDDPSLSFLLGKTVFIGCSAAGTFDAVATPLNEFEPGVMVHATALANLIRGDYLRPVASWIRNFLILAASALTTLICMRIGAIRWQTLFSVFLLGVIVAASYVSFCFNIWLPPVVALIAGVGSFTASTTYNYFVEGKQKRFFKQLFSDFVSPDVLAELQQSGDLNLRGDSRMGTVLFSDLVGFTTFTETATPEQLLAGINTYLAEASQVLLAHGAYIDKFIGDAVMAIFSIPVPKPEHAIQACYSALDLQKMMVKMNEDLGKRYNLSLALRVGVNTGMMIAGPMGYARKLNYSALGDTVNLASRLEGANKSYHTKIMIGPLTYQMVKDHFETRFLDLLIVKGKTKPVEVYELLSIKGSLTKEQIMTRAKYNEGIELYRQRQWSEAELSFKRALKIDPQDGPSQTYLARCEFYQKTPPPADWDGSFGLDTK